MMNKERSDNVNSDLLILIIVFFIFFISSIILSLGKGSFLIAGYNMSTEEEKEKFHRVKITKYMGKLMFLLSLCLLFWVYDEIYQSSVAFYLGIVFFVLISAGGIIYLNTNKKFRKQ